LLKLNNQIGTFLRDIPWWISIINVHSAQVSNFKTNYFQKQNAKNQFQNAKCKKNEHKYYRPQRVISAILCNTFVNTAYYKESAPCAAMYVYFLHHFRPHF
jgi:hypothetical protein